MPTHVQDLHSHRARLLDTRKLRHVATKEVLCAKHRRGTQHGDQICDACLTERDLKRIARSSTVRLARTRAKRKQSILAEVWRLVGEMRGRPSSSDDACRKEGKG